MTAALHKKKYQLAAFMLSMYLAYLGFLAVSTAMKGGIEVQSKTLRFTTVGLRNPNIPANFSQITSLGLLQGGCRVPPVSHIGSANSFYAFFGEEVRADGFYFVTSSVSPDYDPVEWYVQSLAANSSSVFTMASSAMIVNRDGSVSFSVKVPKLIPELRNNTIDVDLRITWEWVLCWAGADTSAVLQYFLLAVSGMVHKAEYAKPLWVSMGACGAFLLAVSAIGYQINGSILDATYQWLNVIPAALFAAEIQFFEAMYVPCIVLYGLVRGAASAIQSIVLLKQPFMIFLAQDLALSTCPVALLFASLIILNRKRILYQAWSLIWQDMKRYDELWNVIKQENTENLINLKAELGQLAKKCPAKSAPRQISYIEDSQGNRNSSSKTCFLSSTDQLFVQAGCLHPLLLSKVQAWAMSAEGSFPVMFGRCASYPAFSEVREDSNVKYGKLKSAERMVEKLVRAYSMVSIHANLFMSFLLFCSNHC